MSTPLEVSWPKTLDYSKQSVEVPGTRRPGQTGHYQNAIWGLIKLETQNHVRTLPDVFEFGLKLSRDKPYLGHRPQISSNPPKFANHYVWATYAQVDERRRNLGSALHRLFAEGKLGGGDLATVGIWSPNRPEWQVIDTALHAYRMVGVSLYDTLGKDAVEYIIQHSHISIVFVTAQHLPTLLTLAPKVPMLKMVVSIDDLSEETRKVVTTWGKTIGVDIKELRELEELGKANRTEPIPAFPNQIATICYTSGTTSTPKGVVLTHGHLTASAVSNLHGTVFGETGRLLSYLPLAHIYERINELNMTALGGEIGFFSGDPLRLLEDAQILRPNYFPSVPRVLNRIYQSAMLAGQAPGMKGYLFRTALDTKLRRLKDTGNNKHALWDRLVFSKVQAVLGGRIKLMTCGSAPISADVMDFLKVAFSCDVIEVLNDIIRSTSYGMTENCGTCTRVWPDDPSGSGSVGAPQPCNEIKLVDVPHMNYTSNDKPNARGELCVRGTNCFTWYYKDMKNTKETVDEEGWLHTGDVGEVDSSGRFRIIDRIKNIMKLAQGEYVALEKVEGVYGTNPLFLQVYVHGDSLQNYLLAIVVPDPIQLAALATRVGITGVNAEDPSSLEAVVNDKRLVKAVLEEMGKEAKRAGLKGFETVKKIHLTMEPFTIDNGLLTPTLKIRRRDVASKYKSVLDALYAEDDSRPAKL